MKRIYIFLFALPLIIGLGHAQKNTIAISDIRFDKTYDKRPYPIIRGKINNATTDELKQITLEFTLVRPNDPMQTKLSVELLNDGTFQLQLPSKLPYQQIWFSLGKYVYSCLYAHEELNLIFDLEKLKNKNVYMLGDGIVFSGKDGAFNQTLNSYIMYNKKHLPEFHQAFQKLQHDDNRYLQKVDSLFNLQREVNANFLEDNHHNAKTIIESDTELEYQSKRILHLLLSQKDEEVTMSELTAPIYAITNGSSQYLYLLHSYINNKKLLTQEERLNHSIKFAKIDSLFPSSYADRIKLQVSSKDLPEQLEINKKLIHSTKSKWIISYINHENEGLAVKIEKIKKLLSAKADSSKNNKLGRHLTSTNFQANLYMNDADSGEELLTRIKALFPGKYIIMDLWATWCGPCLVNMPWIKELQLQSDKEKLPVVFVYLCTDRSSSEKIWKNKIAEIEQPGEHLFVQNNQMNELFNLFNTAGYPTYALIKPNGEINTKVITLNRKIDLEALKKIVMK